MLAYIKRSHVIIIIEKFSFKQNEMNSKYIQEIQIVMMMMIVYDVIVITTSYPIVGKIKTKIHFFFIEGKDSYIVDDENMN